MQTGCCRDPEAKCYEKNSHWAACLLVCEAGVHPEDPPQLQTPWTCLPHRRGAEEFSGVETAASASEVARPLLFCFAVCTSSGTDLDLLKSQQPLRAGIFGCNSHRIFSDQETHLPNSQVLPQVIAQKGVAGAMTATWVNANAFIAAWNEIIAQKLVASHDWVVKADPDCVFVASRLRQHLAEPRLAVPARASLGVYLKNCAAGPRGLQLFGSIEVLSRNAVHAMQANWGRCQNERDHSLLGEDMWLQESLGLLGVAPLEDYSSLVEDGYCPGVPAPEICSPAFLAFHPKKVPEQWLKCYHEANA